MVAMPSPPPPTAILLRGFSRGWSGSLHQVIQHPPACPSRWKTCVGFGGRHALEIGTSGLPAWHSSDDTTRVWTAPHLAVSCNVCFTLCRVDITLHVIEASARIPFRTRRPSPIPELAA